MHKYWPKKKDNYTIFNWSKSKVQDKELKNFFYSIQEKNLVMDKFALKIIYDIKLNKAELAKFQNYLACEFTVHNECSNTAEIMNLKSTTT